MIQPPSLLIGKVWVPVMHFCACRLHCKVHWRVGRIGSYRLISAQPLIGSTIREFCISSALFSTLWWPIVGVNWLTSCQEYRRECFGPVIVPPVDVGAFVENKLICYADDFTLIAVVPSPGVRVTVAESLSRDLVKVSEWCDLWGMKLDASKTKTMIGSRSRTMHPK